MTAAVLLAPPAAGAATNLVGNSDFEAGTSGWNTNGGGSGITVAQVAGGHSGRSAAKVTNTNGSNAECLLNDSPNWVRRTTPDTYRGSLWVRADSFGSTLKLRFREYSSSGTRLAVSTSTIALTPSWQQVTVTAPVTSPGDSTLDFNAYVTNAAPGTCFYADDATIYDPTPSPPPPRGVFRADLNVSASSSDGALGVLADASDSAATAGDGSIARYTFDFGDGSPPVQHDGATATHTYAAAGTYPVTVTIVDRAGNRSLATEQVTVPYTGPSAYPTAVLTMTNPTTVDSPLGMTVDSESAMFADASGSAGGASPLAANPYSFAACWGNGSGGGPGFGYGDEVPGLCHLNLTVTDTSGRQTTTPPTGYTIAEGFESSIPAQWYSNTSGFAGITLSHVAGGHSGDYSAKLENTNAAPATCLLNDAPNMVPKTSAGRYTATLWTRADAPGATLKLRIGEYSTSGSLLGTTTTSTTLSTSWQQVSATIPVTSPGSKLDVNAYVPQAAPGTCFYADDVAVYDR